MKRARPVNALGGTPRKDHLFKNGRSLCGNWMYLGGRRVDTEDIEEEDLCKSCLRKL